MTSSRREQSQSDPVSALTLIIGVGYELHRMGLTRSGLAIQDRQWRAAPESWLWSSDSIFPVFL